MLLGVISLNFWNCDKLNAPVEDHTIILTCTGYNISVTIEGYTRENFRNNIDGYYNVEHKNGRFTAYEMNLFNHETRDVIQVRVFNIVYDGGISSYKVKIFDKILSWNL